MIDQLDQYNNIDVTTKITDKHICNLNKIIDKFNLTKSQVLNLLDVILMDI